MVTASWVPSGLSAGWGRPSSSKPCSLLLAKSELVLASTQPSPGNTLAATTGANLKELMSRMGHASSRAALLYQHASQDRDQALGEAFEVARASDKGDKGAPKRSGTQRARKPKRS
ncbi:hypothetical protein [Actinomadura nitritigenes]|uniref:hypothetical protein n=1 Tax=Actinomadura nitritigenes TaxID=134602 RepID=UPI003D8F0F8D